MTRFGSATADNSIESGAVIKFYCVQDYYKILLRRVLCFDSHAHYDDERFDDDRKETIKMRLITVSYILNASS